MLGLNEKSSLSYSPCQHWHSRGKTSQNLLEKGKEVAWGQLNTCVQNSSFVDRTPPPGLLQGPLALAYYVFIKILVPLSWGLDCNLRQPYSATTTPHKTLLSLYILVTTRFIILSAFSIFILFISAKKNLLYLSRDGNLSFKAKWRILTHTFLFLRNGGAWVREKKIPGAKEPKGEKS